MRNKKIMIPVLVVAFLLAGAGTVFVMMKIKGAGSSETQRADDVTATAETTESNEEKSTDEAKEEKKEPETDESIVERNRKEVEKMRACDKIRDDMNVEIRKEDARYGDDLQKVNKVCEKDFCYTRENVDKTHSDNLGKIKTTYQEKWKADGCTGGL